MTTGPSFDCGVSRFARLMLCFILMMAPAVFLDQ